MEGARQQAGPGFWCGGTRRRPSSGRRAFGGITWSPSPAALRGGEVSGCTSWKPGWEQSPQGTLELLWCQTPLKRQLQLFENSSGFPARERSQELSVCCSGAGPTEQIRTSNPRAPGSGDNMPATQPQTGSSPRTFVLLCLAFSFSCLPDGTHGIT